MKPALSSLAILLIAGFALAHETVCPNGCDSTSIQTAIYAAHPNDTIDVYSGIYNESVVLTKDVTLRGIDTGSGEPIVNGDLYKNGFNMVLRGFGFQSVSDWADAENMTTRNTTLYEGLVVFVQTTRLVLFEFFIRFLQAEGRLFRPERQPPAASA